MAAARPAKVLTVVGNRPQFVKSAPLSLALHAAGLEEIVLHTGQHYDPELSAVFFDELRLEEPRYRLGLRTADVGVMEEAVESRVRFESPRLVVVSGDTNTTLAGARAAARAGVPVVHVEAGLRSGDLSMPEERNRIEVDRLSSYLFAPDERSRDILAAEEIDGDVHVVGDVMADANRIFGPIAARRTDVGERVGLRPDEAYAVLTLHRAANTEPGRLRTLVAALGDTGWTFVFPVHPRTRRVLAEHMIEPAASIHAVDPLGYLDMLALVGGASRVVTDSGGLQKEAYWARVPCVTLRPSTEWVDTVEAGANRLVDPARPDDLPDALETARFPADAPVLYGDGHASERIADVLVATMRGR